MGFQSAKFLVGKKFFGFGLPLELKNLKGKAKIFLNFILGLPTLLFSKNTNLLGRKHPKILKGGGK